MGREEAADEVGGGWGAGGATVPKHGSGDFEAKRTGGGASSEATGGTSGAAGVGAGRAERGLGSGLQGAIPDAGWEVLLSVHGERSLQPIPDLLRRVSDDRVRRGKGKPG